MGVAGSGVVQGAVLGRPRARAPHAAHASDERRAVTLLHAVPPRLLPLFHPRVLGGWIVGMSRPTLGFGRADGGDLAVAK